MQNQAYQSRKNGPVNRISTPKKGLLTKHYLCILLQFMKIYANITIVKDFGGTAMKKDNPFTLTFGRQPNELLEPGRISHSETSRNSQFWLRRKSQCISFSFR